MHDHDEYQELSVEDLIARFLVVTGIPETEWPNQTRKLMGMVEPDEIRAKLRFLEDETSRVASQLSNAEGLWREEEAQRKRVAESGYPGVKKWLRAAIESKSVKPSIEAFAPFQDEVRNDSAFEDIFVLYLSLSHSERLCWNEAIVRITAEFLSTAPNSISTIGLLELVEHMGELSKLASVAAAPISLLDAHCKGRIDLSPSIALAAFRDGCTQFPMLWPIIFKLGDQIFNYFLENDGLEIEDFEIAGRQIMERIHPSGEAQELAEGVAATNEWRRHCLKAILPTLSTQQQPDIRMGGLKLGSPGQMEVLQAGFAALAMLGGPASRTGATQ